jgi:WD40 repeat protein
MLCVLVCSMFVLPFFVFYANLFTLIVHLPTCTVYRNWPTSNTPLGRISSVAISPNSEQLAVGNEQGGIRLWEIRG